LFGYSYSTGQLASSLNQTILNDKGFNGALQSFSTYYPTLIFGVNFLVCGLSFIPVAGGIVYGAALLSAAINFSIIRATTPSPLSLFSYVDYKYYSQINDIYTKVFDPVPYTVVGTITILMGVGDLITAILFFKERDKKRFPYMQKIFSFTPNSLTVNFYF
jgi:hypothetical protein